MNGWMDGVRLESAIKSMHVCDLHGGISVGAIRGAVFPMFFLFLSHSLPRLECSRGFAATHSCPSLPGAWECVQDDWSALFVVCRHSSPIPGHDHV